MNKSGQFSDEDDITRVKFIVQNFHHCNKKKYEMKLHLDSSKGYYLSHVGWNMYELTTGEYKVVFELYFLSASIDHSSVDISSTSSVETISRVSFVGKG